MQKIYFSNENSTQLNRTEPDKRQWISICGVNEPCQANTQQYSNNGNWVQSYLKTETLMYSSYFHCYKFIFRTSFALRCLYIFVLDYLSPDGYIKHDFAFFFSLFNFIFCFVLSFNPFFTLPYKLELLKLLGKI